MPEGRKLGGLGYQNHKTGLPMRLTCPNCKAQYEVEESVIPAGGRDVQCSSCGNTWFQYPASVALQMREADLDDDDEGGPQGDDPAAAVGSGGRIDRTVLDVLRQEAEREISERRRARPGMETQPDLGLFSHPRPQGGASTARPPPVALSPDEADAARAAAESRRSLLPDVDELSSTLEPRSQARGEASEERDDSPQPGRDFRRGLSAVLLVAMVLVGLYLLAPGLSEMVPALAGPLAGYVALVDNLRAMLAGLVGG